MNGVQNALVAWLGEFLLLAAVALVAIAVAYFTLRRLGVNVRVTTTDDNPAGETPSWKSAADRLSIQTVVTDPVVYRLGTEDLERIRRRIAAGEEMDAVCREINAEYTDWGPDQREAFRRVLDAALRDSETS